MSIFNDSINSARHYEVPIWQQTTISIDEAVEYTGIGRDKPRVFTLRDDGPFVLWSGEVDMIGGTWCAEKKWIRWGAVTLLNVYRDNYSLFR